MNTFSISSSPAGKRNIVFTAVEIEFSPSLIRFFLFITIIGREIFIDEISYSLTIINSSASFDSNWVLVAVYPVIVFFRWYIWWFCLLLKLYTGLYYYTTDVSYRPLACWPLSWPFRKSEIILYVVCFLVNFLFFLPLLAELSLSNSGIFFLRKNIVFIVV